jgi:hypothetical protein
MTHMYSICRMRETKVVRYSSRAVEFYIRSSCAAARALFGGRKFFMLWTIFVILLVLWLLGMVSSYTLAGYIHILLVIALVVLVINLVSGRRGAV